MMNRFAPAPILTSCSSRMASRLWPAFAVLGLFLVPHSTFAATPISTCGYVISTPGSYSVTADLTCPGVGILVASSNVDLDLNQHVLTNMSSNDVGIITATKDPFVPGAATLDFSSCTTVTGAHIHGGTVKNFNQGVVLCSSNASTNGPSVAMSTVVDHIDSQNNHVGIAVLSSGHNTLDTNFLSVNDTYAIQLENASSNLIAKNLIDSNNIGISLNNNSNQNTVLINSVTLSYYVGVRLTGSQGNAISTNFFTDSNNGRTSVGIALGAGDSGNTVSGNIAFYSIVTDLVDLLPCGTNTWTNNYFGTAIGGCIH
jgi:Periplasmic copper-binding protein (NosD)